LTARFQTLSYFAAFIALGLTNASLGPTLPRLADQAHTTLSGISLLFTTRSLGYMIGSFWIGRWYDRIPGHRIMAIFLAGMAAAMVCIPLAPTLALLAVVLGLMGMAEGAVDLGGNTLLLWLHGQRVAPFMNALHFFFGFGSFVSPLVIAQLVAWTGGIRWAFWALAVWMVPTALSLIFQRSPSLNRPPTTEQGEEHRAEGANPDKRFAARTIVLLVGMFFFLITGAELGLGGWIYTYTVSTGLGETATGAYMTSAFWGALTAGRLVFIPLSRKLKPGTILLLDLLGAIAGVAIILGWQASTAALWAGTMVTGFSMASLFPTTYTLAGQRLAITGKTSAWFFVGISLGSMVIPWVIGQLFESSGPQAALWIVLAAVTAAVGILATLVRDRTTQHTEITESITM
jgi:FHS family Na+ dependent glucose MFS transporter 1